MRFQSGKLEERDATIVCKDNIIEKKDEELRNLEEKRRYLLNQVQELKVYKHIFN